MVDNFLEVSKVVGQLLPKIYTRRITLEDTVMENRQGEGTTVTVDYHIKDLLDNRFMGLITRGTENRDADALQSEVLSALSVTLMLVNATPQQSQQIVDAIQLSSLYQVNSSLPRGMPTVHALIDQFVNNSNNIIGVQHLARPPQLDFSIRNSSYQQYDRNNNPINVIPYKHKFQVADQNFQSWNPLQGQWGGFKNVCLIAFTHFDFNSLNLGDFMSPDDIDSLNGLLGEISLDVIVSNGEIQSTSILYRDLETNAPYYGPVHRMPNGRYMTGIAHGLNQNERVLTRTKVPARKIQDFRRIQRTSLTNFQPGLLESFSDRVPNLSFIEKRHKNFFDLQQVSVDLDRRTRSTDIEFSVNLGDIYKFNSRYYDLYNNMHESERRAILQRMRIASIEVCRRRMTKYEIGNNHLGGQKRLPFDQVEESYHSVARSGQRDNISQVADYADSMGVLREVNNPPGVPNSINILSRPDREEYYRTFYANDLQIAKMWDSKGVYQYGVKISVIDNTREYFKNILEEARENITLLSRYLQESQIPVFDTRLIHKIDEQNATSANIFDPPSYSSDITSVGNYDTKTETFTPKFIEASLEKYFTEGGPRGEKIAQIVDNFLKIVRMSFSKSFVSLARSSVNITQRDDSDTRPGNNRIEEILRKEDIVDLETSRQAMQTMIHPVNSKPEQIQSFLKSYQDVVYEVEKYFDFTYQSAGEGSGYSAKEPINIMTVERWFSSSNTDVDDDNFIYLDRVYDNNIYSIIGLGRPSISSPRTATSDDLLRRLAVEAERFGILPTEVASFSPDAIVIGSDLILLHADLSELEAVKEERRLSNAIPGYMPKRVITLGSQRSPKRNQDEIGPRPNETPSDDQVRTSMSNMNGFLSLLSGMSSAEVANAMKMANEYDGSEYFTNLAATTELLSDNDIRYGDETTSFSLFDALSRTGPIQVECEGVTLERDVEIVNVSDLRQTIIPNINEVRPLEESRVRNIVVGPFPTTENSIVENNSVPEVDIAHFKEANIVNSRLIASAVATLETKTPNSFNGLGRKNTVANLQSLTTGTKSMSFSGIRTNKALEGVGAYSVSKEFTKLKIVPSPISAPSPTPVSGFNSSGFATATSQSRLRSRSNVPSNVGFGASQNTVQQFQTPNRLASAGQLTSLSTGQTTSTTTTSNTNNGY